MFYLTHVQVKEEYDLFCDKVQNLLDTMASARFFFFSWIDTCSNSDFAKEAQKHPFYGLLFHLRRDNAINVRLYIAVHVRLGWIMNMMKGTEGRCEKRRKERMKNREGVLSNVTEQ